MNTKKVADKLVEYCRTGDWDKAQSELYAENAVSIEPNGAPSPPLIEGIEAIKEKAKRWESMVDTVHACEIDGPVVAGDYFSCNMKMDITMKGAPRMMSEEICVYKVKEGKIVSEQFFYKV